MRFTIVIMLAFLAFGCAKDGGNKDAASDNDTSGSTESLAPQVITQPDDNTFEPNPNQANVAAGADGKVWHFVCADGCEGGHADAKGPCPGCGKELSHNQAYHNTPPTDQTATETPQITTDPAMPEITPNPSQANVPAGADGKVWHFVCSDGCAGGHADAKGPCPGCGKELAHNQAYHNNTNTDAGNQAPTITPQVQTPEDAHANEPPRNAQGVWHYTCPNGCVGGAGGAGPCVICGTTLVHNTGYH